MRIGLIERYKKNLIVFPYFTDPAGMAAAVSAGISELGTWNQCVRSTRCQLAIGGMLSDLP